MQDVANDHTGAASPDERNNFLCRSFNLLPQRLNSPITLHKEKHTKVDIEQISVSRPISFSTVSFKIKSVHFG